MRMQEMTEEEQQTLRSGLRMLARMIARRHLARLAADASAAQAEQEEAGAGPGGARGGIER